MENKHQYGRSQQSRSYRNVVEIKSIKLDTYIVQVIGYHVNNAEFQHLTSELAISP
jgi:hypothetical protein